MNFYKIYFSPTGGTKKVADILVNGISNKVIEIDMIKHSEKLSNIIFSENDVCLFTLPVYGGRIPTVAVEQLQKVKGNRAKAILTVVFGNREIEDALLELQDVLEKAGFTCVAGIEAVAEHSLMPQFGAGRPDKQDEKELFLFAYKINGILENENEQGLHLPGNYPYRKYKGVPLKPSANRKCFSCGLCAKECPAGAISKENPRVTDRTKCISCMHCVSVCPNNARHYSKLLSILAGKIMKKSCSERKENKLWLYNKCWVRKK